MPVLGAVIANELGLQCYVFESSLYLYQFSGRR